eukprot:390540_1
MEFNAQYLRFTAVIGPINDPCGTPRFMRFIISVDTAVVYTSQDFSSKTQYANIDIDVTGKNILRITTDAVGSACGDHAAVSNPILTCPTMNDDVDFALTCNQPNQCESMSITCPKFARCDISCLAANACQSMDVTWPLIAGYGSLDCSGSHACSGINYPDPPPTVALTIDCADTRCIGSEIICPRNAACNIICNKQAMCQGGTKIYCQSNSNCVIRCEGDYDSCGGLQIYASSVSSASPYLYCNPGGGVFGACGGLTCGTAGSCKYIGWNYWDPPAEIEPVTALPSKAPSMSPSEIPTDSPTYQVCNLQELDWNALNTVAAQLSEP